VADPRDAEELDWDEVNEAHLAAHGITLAEVECVLSDPIAWARNKKQGNGDWKVVGFDRSGRPLTLICSYDEKARSIRPFTGWPSTRGERSRYL
jgi:uncharacterized DUF497 family protein